MKINIKQDLNTASQIDKENIKSAIEDDCLKDRLIAPPKDGTINLFLYANSVSMFKILGTAKDSKNNFLFTFSYLNNSISYDLSLPSERGGK